jgi:hypothetical protein
MALCTAKANGSGSPPNSRSVASKARSSRFSAQCDEAAGVALAPAEQLDLEVQLEGEPEEVETRPEVRGRGRDPQAGQRRARGERCGGRGHGRHRTASDAGVESLTLRELARP